MIVSNVCSYAFLYITHHHHIIHKVINTVKRTVWRRKRRMPPSGYMVAYKLLGYLH